MRKIARLRCVPERKTCRRKPSHLRPSPLLLPRDDSKVKELESELSAVMRDLEEMEEELNKVVGSCPVPTAADKTRARRGMPRGGFLTLPPESRTLTPQRGPAPVPE